MSDREGGPAFPGIEAPGGGYYGMTLRDYFAGQALSGLCTKVVFVEGFKTHVLFDREPAFMGSSEETSVRAYELADAMLKARELP